MRRCLLRLARKESSIYCVTKKFSKPSHYTLGIITVLIVFLAAVLFFVNTRYTRINTHDNDGILQVNQLTYFVMAAALGLLEIGITFFAHRRFLIRPNWPIAAVLFVFFAASATGIILQGSVYRDESIIYDASWLDKTQFLCQSVLLFFTLYLFLAIIPKMSGGRRAFDIILILISLFALAGIVYSYITEFDFYKAVYEGCASEGECALFPEPTSFTDNRNLYGYLLCCGVFAEGLLILRKGRIYHWLLVFFYFLKGFAPASKTCLAISAFFIVAMLIYTAIWNLRKHRFARALIPPLAFIAIAIAGSILIFVDFGEFNAGIRNFVLGMANAWGSAGLSTAKCRLDHFNQAIQLISQSPASLFCGYGFMGGEAVYAVYYFGSPHVFATFDSSWGINLLEGGIFGLALSFLAWLFFFVLTILAMRKKSRYAVPYLFLLICFLARSFMEIADLTCLHWNGISIYAIALCPLLSEIYSSKKSAESASQLFPYLDYAAAGDWKNKKKMKIAFFLGVFYLLIVMPVSILGGLSFIGKGPIILKMSDLLLILVTGFSLLFASYLMASAFRAKRRLAGIAYLLLIMGSMAIIVLGFAGILADWQGVIMAGAWFIVLFSVFLIGKDYKTMRGSYLSTLVCLLISAASIAGCWVLFYFFANDVYLYFVFAVMGVLLSLWLCMVFYFDIWPFPFFGSLISKIDECFIFGMRKKEKKSLGDK